MSANHQRIFFAVSLTEESRQQLIQNLIESKIQLPERVLDSSSWHITVFFIGDLVDSKIKDLILTAYDKKWMKKFNIVLDHFGTFPDSVHAKFFWCGVREGKAPLAQLAAEISQLVDQLNLTSITSKANSGIFSPHISLCRLPKPQDLTTLLNFSLRPLSFTVERFSLFRSQTELGPQKYEELASFELGSMS